MPSGAFFCSSLFIRDYFIQKVSPVLMTIILNDLTEFPTLKDTAAYLAVKIVLKTNKDEQKNAPDGIRYA
ncbi:MAG: hypothetical protein AAFO99_14325, partial [Bacteroidota bacterium]